MKPLDDLLERALAGAGRRGLTDPDVPDFPVSLGLEPRGVLGRGASGWVLRAHDPRIGRDVAVKIAHPGEGPALLHEAARTARLVHPAVLPVHRVVESGDRVYVELRLAPGQTLADAPARPEAPLALLRTIADALAVAHAAGIVHGDLHPGNVAVDADGRPYVLDWSGAAGGGGTFDGAVGYAAPEQLAGGPATAASDVFALGVVGWELVTGHTLRPRAPGEPVGTWLARSRDAASPVHAADEVSRLLARAMSRDPGDRPSAASFRDGLDAVLSGRTERAARQARGRALVHRAREALTRFQEGERRLLDEQRVAAVYRVRIPSHADAAEKEPLWAAERRIGELRSEQAESWLAATEEATGAIGLAPDDDAAHAVLAELWWERLRMAEAQGYASERDVALRRVRMHDRGRYGDVLDAPAHVSLDVDTPGATIEIARLAGWPVLRPEVAEVLPAPLRRHPLPAGSWLLTVRAPGRPPVPYPVSLARLEHHRGTVRCPTEREIGDGWVHVPAGPFAMGGDPRARNAMDPCAPFVGDRFVLRTCVTAADWLAFLRDVPPHVARAHVPGESGVFGGHHAFFVEGPDGWSLPAGWDPRWPVTGVSHEDAVAYAAWRSAREGRLVRLPTEAEWEKASRGVDGRAFQWGDGFDPTFCHMRESRPGPPRPAPVGAYPLDRSVYGVLDTAGGMREWTASSYSDGQKVVRGGTWGDDADDCRCASRAGLQPSFRMSFVSFRLIAEERVSTIDDTAVERRGRGRRRDREKARVD